MEDLFDNKDWNPVETKQEASRFACPHCGDLVSTDWSFCRSCKKSISDDTLIPVTRSDGPDGTRSSLRGEDATDSPASPPSSIASESTSGTISWDSCPSCGAVVSPGWSFCRKCESPLSTKLIDVGGSSGVRDGRSPDVDVSEDADVFLTVKEILDEGDSIRAEGDEQSEVGSNERALESYGDAKAAYEEALEVASESPLIDSDGIEQKFSEVEERQLEIHRQLLRDEVETLRSELDSSDTGSGEDFEQAQRTLGDIETRLESAADTATRHGFETLEEEIATLQRRRKERLEEITDRLEDTPIPAEIPGTPDLSVAYEQLREKEHIGGGGNADVTKAIYPTDGSDVTLAIKEPRFSGTLHSDKVERLLEEAATWDRLDNHDHVVGVVDYGSEPMPWIAMEYMDGNHLGDVGGELETAQALWTAIAITKGVRHAHRRGVAHLDLKPENVLFRTVEDGWDVPKVADWGLSKHLLEHSKSVEGLSPQYAAPEQFTDDFGKTDDITDIYQLGALFYELFTGEPPFEGSPAEAMHKVLNEPPTAPSEIASVPQELDEILLTALSKEKDDRFEDVLLLRDALQDLFQDW